MESSFRWDLGKEALNLQKHGVDFTTAMDVFKDPQRKIFIDEKHRDQEDRMFCIGKVQGRVLALRFVYRDGKIRILGAGYWRKWRKYYEIKN